MTPQRTLVFALPFMATMSLLSLLSLSACKTAEPGSTVRQMEADSAPLSELQSLARERAKTIWQLSDADSASLNARVFLRRAFNTLTGSPAGSVYVVFVERSPDFALHVEFDEHLGQSVRIVLPATANPGFGGAPGRPPFVAYGPGVISFRVKTDVSLDQAKAIAKSVADVEIPEFDLTLWSSKFLYWHLPTELHYQEVDLIRKLKADPNVVGADLNKLGRPADIRYEFSPLP